MDFLQSLLNEIGTLMRLILTTAPRLVLVAVVIVLGLFIARTARRVMRRALADSAADPLAKSVLADGAYVGVLFLVTILSLALVGIDVGSLIAGLGLTTLAIGFALRDVLENLVAGVFLLLNQPFKVGDIIRVGPEEGEITDMTVRVTVIKSAAGTEVFIPNRTIFSGIVENKTAYPVRRFQIELPLPPGCDLLQARAALSHAAAQMEGVLPEPPTDAEALSAADGAPRVRVSYWVDSRNRDSSIHSSVHAALREALGNLPTR